MEFIDLLKICGVAVLITFVLRAFAFLIRGWNAQGEYELDDNSPRRLTPMPKHEVVLRLVIGALLAAFWMFFLACPLATPVGQHFLGSFVLGWPFWLTVLLPPAFIGVALRPWL